MEEYKAGQIVLIDIEKIKQNTHKDNGNTKFVDRLLEIAPLGVVKILRIEDPEGMFGIEYVVSSTKEKYHYSNTEIILYEDEIKQVLSEEKEGGE
jgi:hypothetical protein